MNKILSVVYPILFKFSNFKSGKQSQEHMHKHVYVFYRYYLM